MAIVKIFGGIVAAALITGLAHAQTVGQAGQGKDMHGTMQAMMPNSSDSVSTKAYKDIHMKMMMNAPRDFSGDADVDFARQMISHHQSGIEMARVELQHGKDAKLRQAAEKVVADQQKEIAELQAWLKTKGK